MELKAKHNPDELSMECRGPWGDRELQVDAYAFTKSTKRIPGATAASLLVRACVHAPHDISCAPHDMAGARDGEGGGKGASAAPVEFTTLLPPHLRPFTDTVFLVKVCRAGSTADGQLEVKKNGEMFVYAGGYGVPFPAANVPQGFYEFKIKYITMID